MGPSDLRLGCSRRAGERTAAVLHLELSQGGTSLRAIACTAPLLGMFGTDCAAEVAETFVPLALSLTGLGVRFLRIPLHSGGNRDFRF